MKIRQGFVSNSSSSSFIIAWKEIDEKDLKNKFDINIMNVINQFDTIITYDLLFEEFLKVYPDYDISKKNNVYKFNIYISDEYLSIYFYPDTNKFLVKAYEDIACYYKMKLGEVTPKKSLLFWADCPIDSDIIDEKLYEKDYDYSDFDEDDFYKEIQQKIRELKKIGANIHWDVGRD